jgi:uncharacterized protein YfdQ (DUF2303 family)
VTAPETPTSIIDVSGDALAEIVELADKAAGQTPALKVSTGRHGDAEDFLVFLRRADQTVETVDLTPYLPPQPRRKTGVVNVDDPDSFVGYVKRHGNSDVTTLWSKLDHDRVTAVIDDYADDADGFTGDDDNGHGQHRAVLQLRLTPEWKTWVANDGVLLSQAAFAEFLEDNASAIRNPAPTDFIAVARTFTAHKNLKFGSSTHLQSGEVQFQYEETVTAGANRKGDIAIPEEFEVGLVPYEGGGAFAVTARFRYRLTDDGLGLGYRLIRPDIIKQAAFDAITSKVGTDLDLPVFAGTPRA